MTAAPAIPARATDPRDAARFMAHYAKHYSAGAFSMPIRSDIIKLQYDGGWFEMPGVMMVVKELARDTIRRDFTGARYVLPAGATVVTHLAAEADAQLPDLSWAAAVYAYIEDDNITRQLRQQGRAVGAVRVSASSEIIGAWTLGDERPYPEHDAATVRQLPFDTSAALRREIGREVAGLRGWTDDFPFYSDGSWSALNLRGFKADEPTWGIKPAEMSKAWKVEHPEALAYVCDWTSLAAKTPGCVELVGLLEEVLGGPRLERVRLLQMAGRGGKGGRLSRHTDITDKAAGTANGKIARFHIPLVTDPRITMSAWNLNGKHSATHLPAWTLWYLDARKPHAVTNPTGVDRVHLVVDVEANRTVRDHIAAATEHAA